MSARVRTSQIAYDFCFIFGRCRRALLRNPSPFREGPTTAASVLTVVCMAQWIRRLPTEQETAGSNPAMDSFLRFWQIDFRYLAVDLLVEVGDCSGFTLQFLGWRNWQRARLLTGRLRVRASL
jgi:hypothetical protein